MYCCQPLYIKDLRILHHYVGSIIISGGSIAYYIDYELVVVGVVCYWQAHGDLVGDNNCQSKETQDT